MLCGLLTMEVLFLYGSVGFTENPLCFWMFQLGCSDIAYGTLLSYTLASYIFVNSCTVTRKWREEVVTRPNKWFLKELHTLSPLKIKEMNKFKDRLTHETLSGLTGYIVDCFETRLLFIHLCKYLTSREELQVN